MFCFQCEQTQDGTGCTSLGVCGKTPEVASMQDLLMAMTKEIGSNNESSQDANANKFVLDAMFSTLTNVNFDPQAFSRYISRAQEVLNTQRANGAPIGVPEITDFGVENLAAAGRQHAIPDRQERLGNDVVGLQELIFYGLKGTAAYFDHALRLGADGTQIFPRINSTLSFLTKDDHSVEDYLGEALKVGETNLLVTEILSDSHSSRFGQMEPTTVPTHAVAEGKALLVSGHDLVDLENILEQTAGTGIQVYTHGEMLPAHAYPGLKKFGNLVGNWGGNWSLQTFDFATFPGPIVMTSNCIMEPRKAYRDRLWTRGVVGMPGVKHIEGTDFSGPIEQALQEKGFKNVAKKEGSVTTGFGHHAVLQIADKVIDAVKTGDVKNLLVVGGCDGSESERSYFREVALGAPDDALVVTAGCAKYRFNKNDFGTTKGGLPRLLDAGQCNDVYSIIQVAVALKDALGLESVNDLPVGYGISWLEQKAVAQLLTLLHLNIQNIHLGPALPAFATPAMLNILVEKFGITPIGDPATDLAKMLGRE